MRSRASMRTWKAVLVTSLGWFTVILLFLYDLERPCSDRQEALAGAAGHQQPGELGANQHEAPFPNSSLKLSPLRQKGVPTKKVTKEARKTVSTTPAPSTSTMYPAGMLHRWVLPPVVPETLGGAGEQGNAVAFGPDHEKTVKEKFKLHQFNIMASDVISLNRSLPDYRYAACKVKPYPTFLPDTSVIIVFHNEAWSTLLRTVHSVINRSPRALLKEIVLVDDSSEFAHLGKDLENYIVQLPVPVRLFRTEVRSGLIRARLLGAKHATGAVLTFLDAHCECSEGWLEPLLAEIAKNRKTVVCPVIDVISDKSFKYVPTTDTTWGGFSWKLVFRWFEIPDREIRRRAGDHTEPLMSPTMAGGLFSMDREYFYELGSYDINMDIWGAENLEMSFRIWQCGGTLKIVTCSHVGHVFRDASPYSFPGGGAGKVVLHNSVRVANVWLDEYKEFYFEMMPDARKMDAGDVSGRVALRKKLGCKSFHWYLKNIFPESPMLIGYDHFGEIRNKDSKTCLDSMGHSSGGLMGIGPCHGQGGNQIFVYTKKMEVIFDDLCMDSTGGDTGLVKLLGCHGKGGNQLWIYNQSTQSIKHAMSGLCLSKPTQGNLKSPVVTKCDGSIFQQWILKPKAKAPRS